MNRSRTPRIRSLAVAIALSALCTGTDVAYLLAAPASRGWLGLYSSPVSPLPEIEEGNGGETVLEGATSGLRVDAIIPDSPADLAGLEEGDIVVILQGTPFACPPESVRVRFRRSLDPLPPGAEVPVRILRDAKRVTMDVRSSSPMKETRQAFLEDLLWQSPATAVDSLDTGESWLLEVSKEQQVLDLEIELGLRPEHRWPECPSNEQLFPEGFGDESPVGPLLRDLIGEDESGEESDDLLLRLANCHDGIDAYRLPVVAFAHRDPFRLEAIAREITGGFFAANGVRSQLEHASLFHRGVGLPQPTPSALDHAAEQFPTDLEEWIVQIRRVFDTARAHHTRAFSELTETERAFLADHWPEIGEAFSEDIYIHFDEDEKRFRRNERTLELAARVDFQALFDCADVLAQLQEESFLRDSERLLRSTFADSLETPILADVETEHGRFIVGGTGRHWHRDTDIAFLFELGGDDFYTGNAGGTRGWELPLAVSIDLAGDDSYESTDAATQGSGCLGVGGLLDVEGDDGYVGLRWSQGTACLGIGWLEDRSGNDIYRGRTLCQGVGLLGIGLVLDSSGDDRYEGDAKVQGVGLAKGIGALTDHGGDDQYYAKGLYPTGYGDAGIFDSWSQGCGIGFRHLTSGGLGLLCDGGGADRMEAGNFSQGGGYYFSIGILEARGTEDDRYIGSRYNQGFSAHQAAGVFFEEAGDDHYETRQGVAQGLAWDESITYFSDHAGDDHYDGGQWFSQASAAHNSICVFLDRAGTDHYEYPGLHARVSSNSYHDGTSLSLFLDLGGDEDHYENSRSQNDRVRSEGDHGFFLDLPGNLDGATATWRSLERIE